MLLVVSFEKASDIENFVSLFDVLKMKKSKKTLEELLGLSPFFFTDISSRKYYVNVKRQGPGSKSLGPRIFFQSKFQEFLTLVLFNQISSN